MAAASFDSASIPPEMLIFFRDIKEHPDDDTPRLIFADWLQEHGDAAAAARGEFLRLQVLRHRLSPDDPSYGLLKRREGELFAEHCWTWLGPLRDAARKWTFERGMLQIMAQAKGVLSPDVAALAQSKTGLWIDALTLTDITRPQVSQLVRSPLLAHLTTLDLSDNQLKAACRLFFRGPLLPYLRTLILPGNGLTGDHIAALTQRRHFRRLQILDLSDNWLNDTAARVLAESPHLKDITMLRLGHNRFTAAGVAIVSQMFGDRVSL
ncbi:MAG TPA: TIGR02996 domain-containing protein [Gemmataceae bacterium]|nr:TIGR02996 domain-containing protein [Gemmataceae bacterium]